MPFYMHVEVGGQLVRVGFLFPSPVWDPWIQIVRHGGKMRPTKWTGIALVIYILVIEQGFWNFAHPEPISSEQC